MSGGICFGIHDGGLEIPGFRTFHIERSFNSWILSFQEIFGPLA